MGSWNGTCQISNLPITASDKVKLIFIQRGYGSLAKAQFSSYVYSTSMYSPALLAISAQYSDYGSVTDIDVDTASAINLIYLHETYGKKIQVDFEHALIEDYNLEQFIDGIERGSTRDDKDGLRYFGKPSADPVTQLLTRLEMYRKHEENKGKIGNLLKAADDAEGWNLVNLGFVMIRQDVWDKVVEHALQYREYWNPRLHDGTKGRMPYYITGADLIDYKWEKYVELARPEVEREGSFSGEDDAMAELLRRADSRNDDNIWSGRQAEGAIGMPAGAYYHQAYIAAAQLEDKVQGEKVIGMLKKSWSEQFLVSSMMENMRKGWVPHPGGGSQHTGWGTYMSLYANFAVIAQTHAHEEEPEEEDEDSGFTLVK